MDGWIVFCHTYTSLEPTVILTCVPHLGLCLSWANNLLTEDQIAVKRNQIFGVKHLPGIFFRGGSVRFAHIKNQAIPLWQL